MAKGNGRIGIQIGRRLGDSASCFNLDRRHRPPNDKGNVAAAKQATNFNRRDRRLTLTDLFASFGGGEVMMIEKTLDVVAGQGMPTEPGLYWAQTSLVDEFDSIVEVYGTAPFLNYHVFRLKSVSFRGKKVRPGLRIGSKLEVQCLEGEQRAAERKKHVKRR